LSWSRAAVTDVDIFVPDVSSITGNAFQVNWIPMFWFIASDTKLTGNKVTGWAAGLTFIGSETIVGKSLVVN
jgi:hypothetical protein